MTRHTAPAVASPSHGTSWTPDAAAPVAGWRSASKRYGGTLALDELTLDLAAGQVTGLLGPNGAGKTTAVRLLLGLSRPTSGSVHALGGSPADMRVRQRMGAMLQVARVPETLTVAEHLGLFRSYYAAPRGMDDLLQLTGLGAERDRRFGQLSGGQRQRLLFGLALCGNPALLVLDEPTVGLDVGARRAFWECIRTSAAAGCAVLLTTHYLDEVDALAQRVVVLQRGRVVADDTPAGLKQRTCTRELRCTTALSRDALGALPGVAAVIAGAPRAALTCTDADAAVRALVAADPSARDIELATARLEDAFVALTSDAD